MSHSDYCRSILTITLGLHPLFDESQKSIIQLLWVEIFCYRLDFIEFELNLLINLVLALEILNIFF